MHWIWGRLSKFFIEFHWVSQRKSTMTKLWQPAPGEGEVSQCLNVYMSTFSKSEETLKATANANPLCVKAIIFFAHLLTMHKPFTLSFYFAFFFNKNRMLNPDCHVNNFYFLNNRMQSHINNHQIYIFFSFFFYYSIQYTNST